MQFTVNHAGVVTKALLKLYINDNQTKTYIVLVSLKYKYRSYFDGPLLSKAETITRTSRLVRVVSPRRPQFLKVD